MEMDVARQTVFVEETFRCLLSFRRDLVDFFDPMLAVQIPI